MLNANFFAAIETANAGRGDRICFETEEGTTHCYAEVFREAARLAKFFLDLGVKPRARVVVQVDKSPAAFILYLACLRAGLVYVPLNTAYLRAELDYFLIDAEPAILICRPQSREMFQELSAGRAQVFTLDHKGAGTLMDLAASSDARIVTAESAPDDLAVLIYTSGTTGRSKGAMVTHRNLVSNARALIDCWRFSDRDVLLHALPVVHVHGLFVANHCVLLSGARMLWQSKFEPAAVLRGLARATVMMGVPTFYTRLLAESAFDHNACRNVRLFISGSAPLQTETFREFQARCGHAILERYGMSEAGMITSNPLEGERREGSVGFPLAGISVRVADEKDQALPPGSTGGIQVKGENVFSGYWRKPEKTREEFSADGWFRTGDLGVFDRQGYLSIVGRAKDLVISGGYNVYPKEIELALDAMSGVVESAVIGLPDPDFGEAVTGVVVMHPGAPFDPDGMIRTLKGALANYKVPKQVYRIDEMPRNAMGKIQKSVLRERFR
ncbi:MAG: malonate--CoA ligase [Burkholderiales bacterium]